MFPKSSWLNKMKVYCMLSVGLPTSVLNPAVMMARVAFALFSSTESPNVAVNSRRLQ
jgi:hypothetical protein